MIKALELVDPLHSCNVARFGNDANNRAVSTLVTTDLAGFVFTDVLAESAKLKPLFRLPNRIGKAKCFRIGDANQVIGQTLGRFWPNARKPLEFRNQLRERLGKKHPLEARDLGDDLLNASVTQFGSLGKSVANGAHDQVL